MIQDGPNFDPVVVAARERLARDREKLLLRHQEGAPGIQLCAQLTDLVDAVVLELYEVARSESDGIEKEIALVPNGGYGRRDVAPFSDVDLMLLYTPEAVSQVQVFARRLSQLIYDTGLDLGFATRTAAQACSEAMKDATVFTALAESRFIGGSVQLFSKFIKQFRRITARRKFSIIDAVAQARKEERRQYGETVFLLRPNVKRSRGTLRDIQLIRWIGFARYGEPEIDGLVLLGALTKEDGRTLRKTREYLLRLRNELHFHAGKAQDVLNRDEQMRLPQLYECQEVDGLHPVEVFMRDYFELTSQVRYVVRNFLTTAAKRTRMADFFGPLVSHRMETDFRVSPNQISVVPQSLDKVKGDLNHVLHLMDLANLYNKRIDHHTWIAIRNEMMGREHIELTPEIASRFLSLVKQPSRLGSLLRRLHELRVLEKLVPAMAHARCLLQFNEYHQYTVDEHSFRAVEAATDYLHAPGALGEAYRNIQNKGTLHLALLLHDLGKGFVEDHSDVGLRLADETARQLGLSERDAEKVKFLVHKHLLMAHTSMQRDLNDQGVVVQFAMEVGSPNMLQMLYVLTCADLQAVGPGVLNDWKLDLITNLYQRTWRHLTGESPPGLPTIRSEQQRQKIRALIPAEDDADWWKRQIDSMASTFLFSDSPENLISRFSQLRDLASDEALAWGRYLEDRKAVEYNVCARGDILSFHRVVGALTSSGNSILSAEIDILGDGLSLDQFFVHDLDHKEEPPAWRIQEVAEKLQKTVAADYKTPSFGRFVTETQATAADHLPMPTRVVFDNSSSETYTVISIFCYDRLGLLFSLTKALSRLGMLVHLAKIGTYLDQVVDVFYVTTIEGEKVTTDDQMAAVREALLAAAKREDD